MREAWSVMRRAFRYSLLLVVVLGAFCVLLLAATVYTYDRLTAETLHLAEARGDYIGADHFHFANTKDGGFLPRSFESQVSVTRHLGGTNYLFK